MSLAPRTPVPRSAPSRRRRRDYAAVPSLLRARRLAALRQAPPRLAPCRAHGVPHDGPGSGGDHGLRQRRPSDVLPLPGRRPVCRAGLAHPARPEEGVIDRVLVSFNAGVRAVAGGDCRRGCPAA